MGRAVLLIGVCFSATEHCIHLCDSRIGAESDHRGGTIIMRNSFVALLLLPLLSGCAVGLVKDVVTAPIKVGGAVVDATTTSQSEADEKRGRQVREREERIGKLIRKRDKLARDCPESRTACIRAREVEAQIQEEQARGT
jgi:hypothetical protein